MAGILANSPAEIVANLLVLKAYGTEPSLLQTWPVEVADEPDSPDNVITIYDVGSSSSGRSMVDGQQLEQYSIQVRVRSQTHAVGWTKINQIAKGMDENIYLDTVTIGSNVYRVHAISRRGGILPLGKEYPQSQRSLFVVTGQCSIRQIS
jgi:hypothetical protein